MAKRLRDDSFVFDTFDRGKDFADVVAVAQEEGGRSSSSTVDNLSNDIEESDRPRKSAARDRNESMVVDDAPWQHSSSTSGGSTTISFHDDRISNQYDMSSWIESMQSLHTDSVTSSHESSFVVDCAGQPTNEKKKMAECETPAFEDSEEVTAWLLQMEHELEVETLKQVASAQREQEEQLMNETSIGKAWKLVREVVQLEERMKRRYPDIASMISAFAVDDMFVLAETMLAQQEEFARLEKPTEVDLGYHYTREENLSRIRTDGLLTKREREERAILSRYHGNTYGDGIYTANATSYGAGGRFGDVGIVVARLRGKEGSCCEGKNVDFDSTVLREMVVLHRSSQCLALFRFDRALAVDASHSKELEEICLKLNQIVQTCFWDPPRKKATDQKPNVEPQHDVEAILDPHYFII